MWGRVVFLGEQGSVTFEPSPLLLHKNLTLMGSWVTSMANMERLVMAERLRELCFEGKRWFDLVRYSYRHMEGVDIHRTLAQQTSWPRIYDDMMRLVVRKYHRAESAHAYLFV